METTRRDFFRKAGQLTFLSALIGGPIYLLTQDRIQLECSNNNQFCNQCQKLTTCSLEQAKKYKAHER